MNNLLANDLFDNYCKLVDIISQIRDNRNELFQDIDDRIKALEYSKNLCDNYDNLIDLLSKEKEEETDNNQWEDVSVWQEERK